MLGERLARRFPAGEALDLLGRSRWRSPAAPRAGARAARSGSPCVRSAGRRARAGASRSAAEAGNHGFRRQRPGLRLGRPRLGGREVGGRERPGIGTASCREQKHTLGELAAIFLPVVAQPAMLGRQVRCGCLQSMPSSMWPSCAGVIVATPSAGDRQIEAPAFEAITQMPCRRCRSTTSSGPMCSPPSGCTALTRRSRSSRRGKRGRVACDLRPR